MATLRARDAERTFTMQKYILLQHEQDSLRRQLYGASRSSSISSSDSSQQTDGPSPPSSPERSAVMEIVNDNSRAQLMNVNQQIKATLTTMLNCESGKHDATFRLWVSARLMDAEKELKRQRRRSCHGGILR